MRPSAPSVFEGAAARARTDRSASGGFTLLELIVSMAILTLALGGVYSWFLSTTRAAGVVTTKSELGLKATRTLERVAGRLLPAGLETLFPPHPTAPLATSSLTFNRSQGFVNGEKTWESSTTIEFRLAPGETDDGLDNDGNGIVDDGQVVLTVRAGQPDEQEIVLCGNVKRYWGTEVPNGVDDNENGLVDEPGLSFELTGDKIIVRLAMQALTFGGKLLTADVETSVRLRN